MRAAWFAAICAGVAWTGGGAFGTASAQADDPSQRRVEPHATSQGRVEPQASDEELAPTYDEPEVPEYESVARERPTYESVVEGGPTEEADISRRTLRPAEMRRMPGTGGDALRAVESLPGVGRPPLGLGLFIIRGSPPDDTLVMLEDHPIPLPYHLGGLSTVVATDLIDRIEFQPGSFGPRYGRVSGGVIEVHLRPPRRDRVHVAADVDLIDAGAFAETPVGKRAGLALAFRRSYVDLLLPAFFPDSAPIALTQAPRYYDYQASFDWQPGGSNRIRVLFSGSDDALGLLFDEPSEADPALRGGVSTRFVYHGVQPRWTYALPGGAMHTMAPGLVYSLSEGSVGPEIDFRFASLVAGLRDELFLPLGKGASLTLGIDSQLGALDTEVNAPPPPDEREAPDPIYGQAIRHYHDVRTLLALGAYAELGLQATPRLRLQPGLRVDYLGLQHGTTVDPRLRARYRVHERLVLQAAAGFYSQPPRGYQVVPGFGNPDLGPEHGVHATVGFEEDVLGPLVLESSVFVKLLEDAAAPSETENFENTGFGRTIGGEWLVRLKPTVPVFGWLAYTFSRTELRDRPGAPMRLGPFDQTHILTVVVGLPIPGGWEVGARYRLASGFPYVPVVGADFDADFDVYRPSSDPTRTGRVPAYQTLDARVGKRFRWLGLRWLAWLDVQNVTNHLNPEERLYNYDFTESAFTRGLPILPSLGVRAEY